jgi:hypothetical protein
MRLGARHQRAHRPMCPRRRWRADRRKSRYGFAAERRGLPTCGTPPGATPLISNGDLGECGPIGMRIYTGSAAKVTRSGTPSDSIGVMPFSGGWRRPSRPWRRHAGRASRKWTLWCAGDTSPGIGTWPPPIRPASGMMWWGARHGRVVTRAVRSAGAGGDALDVRGLDGFGQGHLWQDGGQPPCQHRCPRPRGPSSRT